MDPEILNEEIINKIDPNKNFQSIKEINGVFLRKVGRRHSISNILIAASITAKARIKLYKGMTEVTNLGGRILYVDTDSIIASFDKNTYTKYLNRPIGEVFFDKNLDDTIILDAVFALPKTYAIRYKNSSIVKIKGFNMRPDFDKFKTIFNTNGLYTTNVEE